MESGEDLSQNQEILEAADVKILPPAHVDETGKPQPDYFVYLSWLFATLSPSIAH